MSADTPRSQMTSGMPAPDPQVLEEFYSVPLEQPVGRELFAVMAALLAHVLQVNNLEQTTRERP
jgi:hypothetical protein